MQQFILNMENKTDASFHRDRWGYLEMNIHCYRKYMYFAANHYNVLIVHHLDKHSRSSEYILAVFLSYKMKERPIPYVKYI
jgi:hypothetical protein